MTCKCALCAGKMLLYELDPQAQRLWASMSVYATMRNALPPALQVPHAEWETPDEKTTRQNREAAEACPVAMKGPLYRG